EVPDLVEACGVLLDVNHIGHLVRMEGLEAKSANSDPQGNRDGTRRRCDATVSVPMIQDPALLSDAREGGCTGEQRWQVGDTQTAQDNHRDEGNLPSANAKRLTGLPLPNPTGFLLQLLQEPGPIRMPRMVVV